MTTIITILLAVALSGFILIENTEKTITKIRRILEGRSLAFKVKIYVTLFVLTAVVVVVAESIITYLLSLLFGFEFTALSVLYVYTVLLAVGYIIDRVTVWRKRRDIIRLARELSSKRSA